VPFESAAFTLESPGRNDGTLRIRRADGGALDGVVARALAFTPDRRFGLAVPAVPTVAGRRTKVATRTSTA